MYFHRTVGALIATSLVLDIGHFPHTQEGEPLESNANDEMGMVNKI